MTMQLTDFLTAGSHASVGWLAKLPTDWLTFWLTHSFYCFPSLPPPPPTHFYYFHSSYCFPTRQVIWVWTFFLQYYCEILVFQLRVYFLIYWNYNTWVLFINYMCPHNKCPLMQRCILTRQLTFHDAITGCHAKWLLSNNCKNSMLMTSLPRSGYCFWLFKANFSYGTTNQKPYPNLGSDASSVWNFYNGCFDVISQGNQWWGHKMTAVFSR